MEINMKKIILTFFLFMILAPIHLLAQIVEYQPESDTLFVTTTTVPHFELVKIHKDTTDILELYVYDGDDRNYLTDFKSSEGAYNNIKVSVDNSDDQFEYIVQTLRPPDETLNEMNFDSLTGIDNDWAEFRFLALQNSVVVDSITYSIEQKFGLSVEDENLPSQISLSQNYPNTFNPSTSIRFDLREPAAISLVVYDLLGREVDRLIDSELLSSGIHQRIWEPSSDIGSGIYIYQVKTDGQIKTRKMTLIK
jgi:hypothetical protein